MGNHSHPQIRQKNLILLAQTTQQLATLPKKELITGILAAKHATNQCDMKN